MTRPVGTRVSHYKAVERLSTSRRVETRVISYKDVEALNPLSVVKLVRLSRGEFGAVLGI